MLINSRIVTVSRTWPKLEDDVVEFGRIAKNASLIFQPTHPKVLVDTPRLLHGTY